jgi:hypothetical protein
MKSEGKVDFVEVFNRADCCEDRLHGATAYLINKDGTSSRCSGTFKNNGRGRSTYVKCNAKFSASYVQIRAAPRQHLHVSEVLAWGVGTPEPKLPEPTVDGIPVSRFSAWKCYKGYPAYGFRFRHHVHGSFESDSHSKAIANGDTSGYSGKLTDESFDGCLTHAIYHDLDKNDAHLFNNIGGITYWCKGDENVNKRCEIYTKTGEDQSGTSADDGWTGYAVNAKMGGTLASRSKENQHQTNLDEAVTCFVSGTDECVDSTCQEISLNDARAKYSQCGNNKHYTNNNLTHKQHQPDHYDEDGNHI